MFAAAACSAATASADQTAVSATVYPSSQGSVSHQTVSLQTLGGCPPYSGANPIYLYPPGQPYQLTSTSWSLSTVLTCGLQIPLGAVTGVQVLNPSHGFEAMLSSADLSDPSQYGDSQAPDALPAISVDGTQDQTTYIRPFRGGTDDNARDEVTESGAPITLVVYTNGPPLIVNASAQKLSATVTGAKMKLGATVQTAGGTPVPASLLTWSWNFGDGTTSTAADPTHQFVAGSYFVTVQVTDASTGTGGTATIQVTTPTSPASGQKNQTGGKKPTKSKSPSGFDNGGAKQQPGTNAGSKQSESSGQGEPTSQPSNQTTSPASASPTSSTSTEPTTTTPSSTSPATIVRRTSHPTVVHRAPKRVKPPLSTPAARGTLVTGRLVSDVTPLPADSSPLVRVTPASITAAPTVRRETQTSAISTLGAVLLVVVLMGLGAWHELRGRRRSVTVSSGT